MIVEATPLSAIPASWHDAWDALALDAEEPNPFLERWFVLASAAHLPVPPGAILYAAWTDRTLAGLVILHPARAYGRQRVMHLTNWMHYHCFYGSPLVRRGFAVAFWQALLAYLDAHAGKSTLLHLVALDAESGVLAGLCQTRRTDIVHRSARALLRSDLSSDAYLETTARAKKRKELRRLAARLADLGDVSCERLAPTADPAPWIEQFLMLEAAGWKGREGAAMARESATRDFFASAMTGAHQSGRLEMIRLALDDRPIATMVNFMTPPGSFSFKIAFDEDFARFSPGVLVQLENLKLLDRAPGTWMDSCAAPNHPMINSLWGERRHLVRVSVPLRGLRRRAVFAAARTIENASALRRRWQ